MSFSRTSPASRRHNCPLVHLALAWMIAFPVLGRAAGTAITPGEATVSTGSADADTTSEQPVLPEDAAARVSELDKQITELREQGQYGKAVPLAEELLAIRMKHQGPQSPAGSKWLDANGKLAEWWEVGDARRLVADLQRRAAMPQEQQKVLGDSDRADRDAESLIIAGKLEEAERVVRWQLEIYRSLVGGEHPDIAKCLDNLAGVQQAQGRAAEAEPLFLEASELRRRLHKGDHPDVATSLNYLASMRRAFGRNAEAEPLFVRALEMFQRLYKGDHPDIAMTMNNLAIVRLDLGRAAEAEPLCVQVLEMVRSMYKGDHPNVALTLTSLAGVRRVLGRAVEAERLFVEALEIQQRLFKGDHPDVAGSLNNLASVRQDLGRYAEAEPLFVQALEMFRRLSSGDHPYVATTLANLAGVRQALGRAAEAERLFVEALEIWQRLFKGDHPDVAKSLNNLASVRQALGRAAEAEPLFVQALEMCQRMYKGDHPDLAQALNNLASVLRALGRVGEAEPLDVQAMDMRKRLYQSDHPAVAQSLNNLAFVRKALGRAAEAEPLFVQALEMRQRLFKGDNPDVAGSLNNLAAVRGNLGRNAEAEPLYRQAFDMSERLRVQTSGGAEQRAAFAQELRLSDQAFGLASVLVELHRGGEALAVLERGRARAALDLLEQSGRDLPAEARAQYDAERTKRLEAAQAREDQARTDLASAELLLAGTSKQRTNTESRSDLDADAKAKQLAEFDQQIARLSDDVKDKRAALTQAGSAVLVELRGLFPAAKARTLEEILSGLSPDEAVVSFAISADKALTAVAARGTSEAVIVADGKYAVQRLVESIQHLRRALAEPAGRAAPIDASLVQSIRLTLLPESILKVISGARRWIILPDGPLNGIPFEVLWDSDGGSSPQFVYAPSATVYIDRKGKGRDGKGTPTPSDGSALTAVVVGDPDFGAGPAPEPDYPKNGVLLAEVVDGGSAASAGLRRGDVLLRYGSEPLSSAAELGPVMQKVQAAATQPTEGHAASDEAPRTVPVAYWRDGQTHETQVALGRMGVYPSPSAPDAGLRFMKVMDQITRGGDAFAAGISATDQVRLFGGHLSPLPGTGREARAIAALLKSAGAKTDSGGAANPQPVPSLEHATSGSLDGVTLLTDAEASVPNLWKAVTSGHPRYLHLATHGLMGTTDRPMDASLALARPKRPTAEDAGFLRLEDLIARWGGRLEDCDLVVLSACDTQRGERKGDSLMNLPLGFFFAGAKTVIASLWQVDDVSTSILMEEFYRNLLQKKLSKIEALHQAQRTLRTMTVEEVRRRSNMTAEQFGRYAESRGIADGDSQSTVTAGTGAASKESQTRGLGRIKAPQGTLRSTTPYAHPYYWAGFILIGDPGE